MLKLLSFSSTCKSKRFRAPLQSNQLYLLNYNHKHSQKKSFSNLTLTWQPKNTGIEIAILAKNIFDSDVREPTLNNGATVNVPYDLPLAGRATWVQLTYHFN